MISFRYHLVSIIAVFLALALGIVVGTTGLNGEILKGLKAEVSSLRAETSTLRAANATLQQQADSADQYVSEYTTKVLDGTLTGRTVAVISAPGVPSKTQSGIDTAIAAAGGKITARLQLTSAYVDPQRGQDIVSLASGDAHPSGLQLPATSDPAILGGDLLAFVLSGRGIGSDLGKVVAGFTALNMVVVEGADPTSAQLAVVVTAGTLAAGDPRAKAMPAVVSAFSQAGLETVVAGDTASATGAGLIATIRANSALTRTVSTVDNATTALGQVSTVLALSGLVVGKAGQYGTGPGVDRLFPAAAK